MSKIKTQIEVRRYIWSLVKAYATSKSLTINQAVDTLLSEALTSVGYHLGKHKAATTNDALGQRVLPP
jgi:hypothetical protein